MKSIFYIIIFSLFSTISAQNYKVEDVEKTTDAKVIANFIKNNPDHPKTPEFKRKLYAIINGENHTSIQPLDKKAMASSVRNDVRKTGQVSDQNKKTAELLTHLFNNDANKREAYIHIKNQSKCNIIVQISGNKKSFYNLTVPANNDNYILVNKGNYTLSTTVCDAKYSQTKNIQKDTEITIKYHN